MKNIDIVIRWVDDSDVLWQREKERYKAIDEGRDVINRNESNGDIRYRDWGLLKYWFRGIEKYAPWARKIFFITCGQKPDWLNVNHPKLCLINHEDFIPHEWLPTFSSRTIDFNVHRIPDLSEQFLFMDDDTFIISDTKDTDFFIDGLPCDSMVFNAITPGTDDVINTNVYNNVAIINRHFSKDSFSLYERLKMWFTPAYGKYLYKNIVLSPWTYYVGFQDFHIPEGFLKETYRNLWSAESEWLSETCSHKFRKDTDVNQWLIRYWQLADKKFVPRNVKIGKYCELSDANEWIHKIIREQKYKLLCINEGKVSCFAKEKRLIQKAFETILPEKSGYEK